MEHPCPTVLYCKMFIAPDKNISAMQVLNIFSLLCSEKKLSCKSVFPIPLCQEDATEGGLKELRTWFFLSAWSGCLVQPLNAGWHYLIQYLPIWHWYMFLGLWLWSEKGMKLATTLSMLWGKSSWWVVTPGIISSSRTAMFMKTWEKQRPPSAWSF